MSKLGQIAEALAILDKPDEFILGADHDIVWAAEGNFNFEDETYEGEDEDRGYIDSNLSLRDNKRMYELGFHVDTNNECWAFFC